jgi:hypothetical protein
MNSLFFEQYKSVKEKFNYIYKSYNLKYLIPGYLNFVFAGQEPPFRDVFKAFYTSTTSLDFSKALDTDCSTLVTFLINRTDYNDLAIAAAKLYPNSKVVNLSQLPDKRMLFINPIYIKHLLLAAWLIFSRSIGNRFTGKLFYIALTVKILNQIYWIEKIPFPSTVERYICFNSAYKEESILTSYFNNHQIETITTQHGIFCDFKQVIPFDIINHENLISKKLLSWGQSTVDYMADKGMDSSRFILSGNLKYKNTEIGTIHQTFKSCLVLLGRELYIDTNNKLLEVLTEYNKQHGNSIKFYIKKHPFLMDEEHKKFANISRNMIFLGKEHSVQEVLRSDLVDFSISVNTTAYYESLALSKPCLRWTESENEVFYGIDDKFENMQEFEGKIRALREMQPEIIQTEIKKIIQYIFNPNLIA